MQLFVINQKHLSSEAMGRAMPMIMKLRGKDKLILLLQYSIIDKFIIFEEQ